MVSQSWQNCLEGPQNCPQGRGFCLFFLPRGCNFTKIFCPGAGNLTTLKKFPGGQPGGCWCLELIDALHYNCTVPKVRSSKINGPPPQIDWFPFPFLLFWQVLTIHM